MITEPTRVDDDAAALLTDLYELTMLQAYWRERLTGRAVFSLYFRKLPQERNYLLACGLDDALRYLERVRFTAEALEYLATLDYFTDEFLRWLEGFRFRGDVYALAEGTPVFPEEPILEVAAPIAEAQLAESLIMNQVHVQTVLASKAARVVAAAGGRAVVDFALRRMHGADAAVKGARAFYVAGVAASSNVLAGQRYGIPVRGTMAHSYVQAHDRESEAFLSFATLYPGSIMLVDTYDTLEGVRRVIELAREHGDAFRVSGVRLDSGDLFELSVQTRRLLDEAGLNNVQIFASGGLDEHRIAELLGRGAPIDGFGVGTDMGVARDAPALDLAYKLTEYGGRGRLKTSPGKVIIPGRKQVFRQERDGRAAGDVIARHDERLPGRPLLEQVMREGERLPAGRVSLDEARARARGEVALLPERLRALEPADPPYLVALSDALAADLERARSGAGD